MSTTPANPKQMYGDMKLPVQLVPPSLNAYAAWSLSEGGIKYGPYNYRDSDVEAMTYIGAILRHCFDYLDGQNIDPDSIIQKPTLAGIAGSVAVLIDATERGRIIDNRPAPGNVPEIMIRYAKALTENQPAVTAAIEKRDKLLENESGSSND